MTTRAPAIFFALVFLTALGCGDDDGEEPIEPTPDPDETVSVGEVQGGIGDNPVDEEACRGFCEKANECARAQGRAIPPEAADCARSCAAGGIHRQAPESIYACGAEECGPAFLECSRRAMIAHMRDRDVAVFPPVCQGLCEKTAYCNRQMNVPPGPGEDDCEAACRAGGAYAEVSEREVLCVHQPCGPPFLGCRRDGGPTGPVQVLPTPSVPPPSDSP